MPWCFLDDHLDEHPRVMAAEAKHPLAPWLFVKGLLYCRRAGLNGRIPAAKVAQLQPKKARDALLAVGLWESAQTGDIVVHDWAQWNVDKNPARSASARNAAQIRWAREHANGPAP